MKTHEIQRKAVSHPRSMQPKLKNLQKNFDQLVAYFTYETGNLPSETTIVELLEWINFQISH